MTESQQSVRLDDEQASAADIGNAMQLACPADPPRTIDAPPRRPQIFFIFAADEALEVDSPDYIVRLHEVQSGKRNRDCCGPASFGDTSFRGPHSVPAGITVTRAGVRTLLFRDQSVALRAQRLNSN